jgi:hypothetical protein
VNKTRVVCVVCVACVVCHVSCLCWCLPTTVREICVEDDNTFFSCTAHHSPEICITVRHRRGMKTTAQAALVSAALAATSSRPALASVDSDIVSCTSVYPEVYSKNFVRLTSLTIPIGVKVHVWSKTERKYTTYGYWSSDKPSDYNSDTYTIIPSNVTTTQSYCLKSDRPYAGLDVDQTIYVFPEWDKRGGYPLTLNNYYGWSDSKETVRFDHLLGFCFKGPTITLAVDVPAECNNYTLTAS